MSTSTTGPPTARQELDLTITGMTCASCVARVEKKLNKLDGVDAVVNLATERAHVTLTAPVPVEDLIAAVDKAGYGATVYHAPGTSGDSTDSTDPSEHDTSAPVEGRIADLRRRLTVAAVLGVPVMALSMITALQFPGWQWLVATLTLPIAVWCAWPFHRSAAKAARHGSSTMDTLVSMGVSAATGWSLWALLLGGAGEIGYTMDMSLWPAADAGSTGGHAGAHSAPHLYFETAAMIVAFLLLGRFLEARSRHRAGDALRSLMELGAKDVALLTPIAPTDTAVTANNTDPTPARYTEQRVPVERLTPGTLFRVRPGEKIATDGVIVEGRAAVDTSVVTGESLPIDVAPGDPVTGATVATDGTIIVRATRVGTETTLAQIAKLVADAQTGKAPVQRLADRISAVFVPAVIGIAVLTLLGWLLTGHDAQSAFTAAVSVLVIACPCALGLATPTALLVGTGRAAKLGVIIKGPEILESTRRIDIVVLDKTGTVTQGRMALTDVALLASPSGDDGDDALILAAAVEAGSEHPVARAIVAAATERLAPGAHLPHTSDFVNHAGRGVSATVTLPGTGPATGPGAPRTVTALVGRLSWLAERGVDPAGLTAAEPLVARAEDRGDTAVVLAADGRAVAVLAVRDALRATSAQAIRDLRALGVTPHLLTGDNERAALRVAAEVGIAAGDVTAGVLPADKVTTVRALQDAGHVVAMVGDGVNDAAALAQADLGLAMGTGTDAAIDAGDLTLVRADLATVPVAIRVSRATLRIIKQNLTWAFGYNVIAIPLAIAGLINPGLAAAFMAASSVIVVTNSLRLRRAG